MSKNSGQEYEQLVRDLFEQILNQDVVETISVQQNVLLAGKSTIHQIDVYWKFKTGGVTYETIVQAKDWSSKVDQGELIKFKGVLDDLPNQPRGVFVTRTGFQSGAENFAKANGILLFELREPSDEDLESWVTEIRINIKFLVPRTTNIALHPDRDWTERERRRLGQDPSEPLSMTISGDAQLRRDDGSSIGTLMNVFDQYYQQHTGSFANTDIVHEFTDATFIETGEIKFPLIKLNSVTFTIAVEEGTEEKVLITDPFVGFILKNVLEDEHFTFDRERKLKKP